MNSTLNRALAAALLACGGAAAGLAQNSRYGTYDDLTCVSPTNPYSSPYITLFRNTSLFGAGIGILGTANYANPPCPPGGSFPVAGRIGFAIGPQGSIQDDLRPDLYGGLQDNALRLTEGLSATTFGDGTLYDANGNAEIISPSFGGLSYARVYVVSTDSTGTQTTNSYLYGAGGSLDSGYYPSSGRYMVTTDTVTTGISAQCVVEVLADGARVNWTLTNGLTATAGTTTSLGLYFGQDVVIADAANNLYTSSAAGSDLLYITVPGRKPITTQQRFTGATAVPAYVNFSANQTSGWGLQVVNNASALSGFDPSATIDQTQVDEFVLGLTGGVLNSTYGATDPTFPDSVQSGDLAASLSVVPAYLQKWLPVGVASGASRTIRSYYRSTSFDSSYAPLLTGYSVAVDTPKAISTTENADGTVGYDPSPARIRVNVDNVGGFSLEGREVIMTNAVVTLNLPNGLTIAGTSDRSKSITISQINPRNLGFVDFNVAVDPTIAGVSGAQTYTVTVSSTSGSFPTKTVTGTINVATTPRLQIRNGPNLVSPPWEFDDTSWSTVLGDTLNSGFQAYAWDAQLQRYVPQANANRRIGTWIVSTSDRGNLPLSGTPQTPSDQLPSSTDFSVGGAGSITLYPGWNLVGNPYTYAFPIGGLLGIVGGRVLTYNELISSGYTDGAFTAYDQALKSYSAPIQGASARLQPNLGYWIYSYVQMDLQFPPLYDLFIRSAAPAAQPQRYNNWRLQLSAANSVQSDSQNFVGIVRNPDDVAVMTNRKAPISPDVKGNEKAIRAYVSGSGTSQMAQVMRNSTGQQKFNYTVESRSAGPVTISWPNLKQIPSNLAVQVKDTATGRTIDARSTTGYTFSAGAASSRTFQVTVTPLSTVAQRVSAVSTTTYRSGATTQMKINYFVTGRGSATITVLKGNQVVSTVAKDVDVAVGSNSVTWPMVDNTYSALPNGTYTLQVAATGESGATAYRQATITVKR